MDDYWDSNTGMLIVFLIPVDGAGQLIDLPSDQLGIRPSDARLQLDDGVGGGIQGPMVIRPDAVLALGTGGKESEMKT